MDSWCTTFLPSETLNQRLKKAAHVKPSPAQLRFMERGYIGFIHYSPNTFTNRQWGSGSETSADFCPDQQAPEQWVRVCKAAGMRQVIPTLKHHDGFCQWPTKTTDFSVEYCPVKQDIAGAVSEECRRLNIDLGVYLSPWDMHQRGLGVWNTPAYQTVYLRQLQELMTQYGEISELWVDGACGDYPVWKAVPDYEPETWYDLMEKEQPSCVVRRYDPFEFADVDEWEALLHGQGELKWRGKAVRWVGNEDGTGRRDEWSVQPVFCRTMGSEATIGDLGEESYYTGAVGAVWYPNEVNTHLLNQWFWNEETSHVRSLDELIDIFYHSIGNNGVLLLNISPDRHGVIEESQITRLMEFRQFMDDTFGTELGSEAVVTASSQLAGAAAGHVLNNDNMQYWSPDAENWDVDRSTAFLELRLPSPETFDNLLIQEAVYEGQRVAYWRAQVWVNGTWRTIAEKKTIGYKTICRFPVVTTDRVRIEILRSWDTPLLSRVSLHLTKKPKVKESVPIEAGAQWQLHRANKYRLVIFDLDGTTLNTLEDLANSLNTALDKSGFPRRSLDEVRSFVGNGIRKLVERGLPEETAKEAAEKVFFDFTGHYKLHCSDNTKPYDGIKELITSLREAGYLTAVVSNKADDAVQSLCRKYFYGLFDVVVGEKQGVRRKPAPDTVNEVLQRLKINCREAVYIGDSEVDIETARNAAMDCISVDWGFRSRTELIQAGAATILSQPIEILNRLL